MPQKNSQDQSQPTRLVEPVLGFTPKEYQEVQEDPDINVEDLLQIEPCTKYIKIPIQTLDGIHVNQPKRFLPFAKEALKIIEALHKEQQTVQWAGLPPKNLVQDCFVKQLNSLQIVRTISCSPLSKRISTTQHH